MTELVRNWSSVEVKTLIEKTCCPPAKADGHQTRNKRLVTAEQTARALSCKLSFSDGSINSPILIILTRRRRQLPAQSYFLSSLASMLRINGKRHKAIRETIECAWHTYRLVCLN